MFPCRRGTLVPPRSYQDLKAQKRTGGRRRYTSNPGRQTTNRTADTGFIWGNRFLFRHLATKITTPLGLTSNIEACVKKFSLPSSERKTDYHGSAYEKTRNRLRTSTALSISRRRVRRDEETFSAKSARISASCQKSIQAWISRIFSKSGRLVVHMSKRRFPPRPLASARPAPKGRFRPGFRDSSPKVAASWYKY